MPLAVASIRSAVPTLFVRRPAVPFAFMLLAGIVAEPYLGGTPGGWLVGAAACIVGAAIGYRWGHVATSLLLVATFAVGFVATRQESSYFPRNHVALFTTDEQRLAEVELTLVSPPRTIVAANKSRPLPPKQSVRGEVTRINTTSGWQAATGGIVVQMSHAHPRLAVGQRVRVVGMLDRPAPATNPGQFDWETYYRRDRVLAAISVPHLDGVTILADPGAGVIERLREGSRRLMAMGFAASRSREHALLQALVLGDRDPEMRDAQDDFAHSGAAHLLAVSGLHVVIVAAFAMALCRLFGLHPRTATWVMIAAVIMYGVVVIPGAPSKRATVLCVAYGIGRLTRRTGDGIQLLALCAAGLLLVHPHDLYTAGFQLSFGTVLGMLVAGRRVSAWVIGWFEDEHTRVARSFRPPGFWEGIRIRCLHHVCDALAIGFVAWLVSMPLVMIHFQQVNPWAIPFGILIFPLVGLGLLAGVAKMCLTLAVPSLAHAWAVGAAVPMVWLRNWVHWLATRPAADLSIPNFPLGYRLCFYAILILPLLPWTLERLRRWIRCAPVAACGLAMLPVLLGSSANPAADEIRVTLLSIGAGQIAVLELPGDRTVLIDAGSDSVSEPVGKVLGPYLRTRGRSRVDTMFLSHPDFDHISGAAETADDFRVRRVVTNPVFRGQSNGNAQAEMLLQHLDDGQVPVDTAARGATLPLDERGEAALDVLWPPPARRVVGTNNAGLVLRLRANGHTVLFPADIQVPTLRELTAKPEGLASEVLVAPHHGSAEVATGEFLAAVNPKWIVSSNGSRLSKKQREFDRLAADREFYRTSVCGAITIHLPKNGAVRVESFLPLKEEKVAGAGR